MLLVEETINLLDQKVKFLRVHFVGGLSAQLLQNIFLWVISAVGHEILLNGVFNVRVITQSFKAINRVFCVR